MFRAALLAIALTIAAYASAGWLTHDFQIWTAEGARRLEVALHPVPSPHVTVDGAGVEVQPLPRLFAADGAVTLVDFIYTRCQTVCLSLGSVFQQLQTNLLADREPFTPAGSAQRTGAVDSADRIKLLSISFDGEHDTPQALQAYADRLGADPSLWRFVRVPGAAPTQQLLRRFQVVVVPDGRGDYQHNAALLVVDAQGRLVRVFDYAEQQMALDYARALAAASQP